MTHSLALPLTHALPPRTLVSSYETAIFYFLLLLMMTLTQLISLISLSLLLDQSCTFSCRFFLVAPISLPVGLFGSLSALPIPCKLQSLRGLSSLQPCCRGCISKERGSLALCHPVQQHCPFSSCLAQSSSW